MRTCTIIAHGAGGASDDLAGPRGLLDDSIGDGRVFFEVDSFGLEDIIGFSV